LVICDEDNCESKIDHLKELYGIKEHVFVGKSGILNDIPLRFPNEPCRHKTIDLLGDLSLIGVPLKAHVLAARSGHSANVTLVRKIRREYEKKLITTKYQKKAKGDYLLDTNAILKIMPHRYPFLLVDRVEDIQPKKRVVAIKNVTMNEPFFSGHFPGHPIMPGVLIVEAMAQVGGVFAFRCLPEEWSGSLVYFLGIDKVRFRKPVVPGDQLRLRCTLLRQKKNIFRMRGEAYVEDSLVAEAELLAAIERKKTERE